MTAEDIATYHALRRKYPAFFKDMDHIRTLKRCKLTLDLMKRYFKGASSEELEFLLALLKGEKADMYPGDVEGETD